MDVTVSALRAEFATWTDRVLVCEEIVITDRGPVARMLCVDAPIVIDQLTQQGVLDKPRRPDRPAGRSAPACGHADRSPSW